MGGEIPNVELARVTAKQWVRNNYGLIQSSLQRRVDEVYTAKAAEYTNNASRQTIFAEENLSEDPFSNRFCGVWVLDIPQEVLGPMERIGVGYIGEKKVHFKDRSTGKKIERGHTYLECGRIITDAVFGQFVNLDDAIRKHPNLFVDRVFVGTKQEAARAFHVKY